MGCVGKVHRFMASLTEAVYKAQGRTVLYIPQRLMPGDVTQCLKDKDLLHQMESIIIHWTRQIKDIIYESESELYRKETPEISFYCFRYGGCADASWAFG